TEAGKPIASLSKSTLNGKAFCRGNVQVDNRAGLPTSLTIDLVESQCLGADAARLKGDVVELQQVCGGDEKLIKKTRVRRGRRHRQVGNRRSQIEGVQRADELRIRLAGQINSGKGSDAAKKIVLASVDFAVFEAFQKIALHDIPRCEAPEARANILA